MPLTVTLLVAVWNHVSIAIRDTIFTHADITIALPRWRLLVICSYLIWFVGSTTALWFFLRLLQKSVIPFVMIVCTVNLFVVWLLFALAALTSDPITRAALTPVYLGTLSSWLYCIACLCALLGLYILLKGVDTFAPRPIDDQNSA
jgi:hypothetical protein